ncbi:MAG: hypothetical protein HQ517_13510 [SAR324 cluster bacterium]|nr:hypothetical protein [SAR324 cluster bacterium]
MIPIIETKLIPYQLPSEYIDRPRLFRRMSEGKNSRLMILFGGGGWGKSLLVATYLKAAQFDAAWVNLDRTDRDPLMFLRYIIEAIHQLYPGTTGSLSALLLESSGNEQWQPIVTALINTILQVTPKEVRLVLDDFHLVEESEPIKEILLHLLNYSPPNLQILLISRRKPSIPLTRFSIGHKVIEFGTDQLGFSHDEMYYLFQKTYKKQLNSYQLDLLSQYTDGWPISLRIFGETIIEKSEDEIQLLLGSLTKAKDSVIRYFDEEVFSQLQDDIRLFLLKTSILDRFDSSLCDFLLGTNNSREFIDRVLQKELYLVRLDENNQWYRYHQPFRRFLKDRLAITCSADELAGLFRKAATYFQKRMDWQNATHHFVMAEDFEAASDCIEQVVKGYFGHPYYESITEWLDRLPNGIIEKRAGLLFGKGWLAVAHGNYSEAEVSMNQSLVIASDQDNKEILGRTVDFLMLIYTLLNKDEVSVQLYRDYDSLMEPNSEYRIRCKVRMAVSLLKLSRKTDAKLFWDELKLNVTEINTDLSKEIQAAKGIHYFFPSGQISEAIQLMEDGLVHYQQKANLQLRCELIIHLYYANRQLGKFSESRKWLDELTEIRKRTKNLHLIDYITCIQAGEDLQNKRFDSARQWVGRLGTGPSLPSLDALKSLVRAGVAMIENDMDTFHMEAENGITIIEQLGNGWVLFSVGYGIACLYANCGENQRAKHLLEFCLEKIKEIDTGYRQALCYLYLASVELNLDNRSSAATYLTQSLAICDQKHFTFLLTDIEADLSQKLLLFALFEKIHLPIVARLLGKMSPDSAFSIIPVLNNQDPDLRMAAVNILAAMKYREAEKEIAGLTNDADIRIRQSVQLTLKQFRNLPPVPLHIYTFGRFRVIKNNHEISAKEWRLKMASSLFKFLLYQKENIVSFDRLMDTFYRDVNEKDARTRLHKAASRLRASLEPGIAPKRQSAYLKASDGFYQLVLPKDSFIDTYKFEQLFQKGDQEERYGEYRKAIHSYDAALDLYKGEWLEEDVYEDWTQALRTRFSEMALEILRRKVRLYFQIFEYDWAIETISIILDQDNCDESTWFLLMKCHLAKGNRRTAVKVYHTCREILMREMDISPDSDIEDLFRSIR